MFKQLYPCELIADGEQDLWIHIARNHAVLELLKQLLDGSLKDLSKQVRRLVLCWAEAQGPSIGSSDRFWSLTLIALVIESTDSMLNIGPKQYGCGSKPMVPFWGRCTTHFSLF